MVVPIARVTAIIIDNHPAVGKGSQGRFAGGIADAGGPALPAHVRINEVMPSRYWQSGAYSGASLYGTQSPGPLEAKTLVVRVQLFKSAEDSTSCLQEQKYFGLSSREP